MVDACLLINASVWRCGLHLLWWTAAFLTQTICIDDNTIKFEIWDTAGQERYHSLAPMYYRGAQAAIIVYDITSQVLCTHSRLWLNTYVQNDVWLGLWTAFKGLCVPCSPLEERCYYFQRTPNVQMSGENNCWTLATVFVSANPKNSQDVLFTWYNYSVIMAKFFMSQSRKQDIHCL